MIYGGNRHTELLDTQIRDIKCEHCKQNTEHQLIIYCSSFVLGIFLPLHWWSRKKEGYMRCKNCGTRTKITDQSENLPKKIVDYWNETNIPFYHKLPTILAVSALFITGYFLIFKMASSVFTILQPAEKKLSGRWEDTYNVYALYFYDDQQFTAVGYDTIAFGKYEIEENAVKIPLFGVENEIPKSQIIEIPLQNHLGDRYRFTKKADLEKFDEIYRAEKNLWRKKAVKPQTDEELRQRVLQYLTFEMEKFRIADEEKVPFVREDVNGPVVFAANGYQVNSQSSEKWRLLFHNDLDWQRANEILLEEFPREFKGDPNEENMFDQNVRFLELYIRKVKASDLKFLDQLLKSE